MPLLDNTELADVNCVNEPYTTLVFGAPKTGKSKWFFESGATYHNVIYLDIDNAASHKKLVPADQASRFMYIPMYKKPMQAWQFLNNICFHPYQAIWNNDNGTCVEPTNLTVPAESNVSVVNLSKANSSTRIVIDGWATICQNVYEHFGTDVRKDKNLLDMDADRSDYKSMFSTLNGLLTRLKTLPCNVDIITWEEQRIIYDPRTVGGGNKASDARIEEVVVQPVSVSTRHGGQLSGSFTQVVRMESRSGGVFASYKSSREQIAGGSLLKDGESPLLTFPFSKFVELSGRKPETIQPITDVAWDTTLAEHRSAGGGTGIPKKPLILGKSSA